MDLSLNPEYAESPLDQDQNPFSEPLPEGYAGFRGNLSSKHDSPDQTPPPSRASGPTNEQQFSAFIATPYWTPLLTRETAHPFAPVFGNGSIECLEKAHLDVVQRSKKNLPGDSTSPANTISRRTASPNWSKLRDIAFVISVCSAQFLSLACLAQTVAPLTIIGNTFNVEDPAQLSWFTAAYSMTLGAFILPSGRLGDVFGHKKIFMLGWLWLSCTSSLVGFAHSWGPTPFNICRGLQGIGPALLVPNAMGLIGHTYPVGDKRAVVLSIFAACGPSGFLTGAMVSSIIAEFAWWPWAFWATAMVCLFICFFVYCAIPEPMAKSATSRATELNFDYLGCITGVSGLILINFALNQAPLVGWDTPYVGFLLIIGLLLVFGFVCVELHETTTNPILPIRGLQPQAILALGCIAAGWASHGIWIYYLYLFQTNIRHLTPTLATVRLIPVAPIGVLFALSTNFLIKKLHVSRVMLLSMIFFLAGILLLAFAPADQSYWLQTFFSVIITPGGMNLSFPAATILLSNAMPREYQGKAASLVSTVLNYSIASGLGFAGSIQRRVNADGPRILEGYRCAWYLGIGFNVLGLLISMYFIWSIKSRR